MDEAPLAKGTLDRLGSFRVVYAGIFLYVVLSVAAIQIAESMLATHFVTAVTEATRVSPAEGPVVPQIQQRVHAATRESAWTRVGGVRVIAFVLGADSRTPIYLEGRTVPPPSNPDPRAVFEEASRLLPAISDVKVSLPLDSLLAGGILVAFGAILIPILFRFNASVERRDRAIVQAAVAARNVTADRARSIQSELEKVRQRLGQLEPVEREHASEIRTLERERAALQTKLEHLARQEASLRDRASRSSELEQEREALEDLLDEAVQDLEQKEREIGGLEERLRSAAKGAPSGGRTRTTEQLTRRIRTLYRNLEVDDHAISDIVALRDENMKLRAEEALKKLDEDPETAGVRRKVGGLPPHLSIFELGFAGKGRMYYARGKQRTYRVLSVGAKNTQKTDLEYLSRLNLD